MELILELKQIHRNINCTTVHVCHDFTEAVSLGDRITLIDNGSIRQIGTPQEIFRQPNSEFVARFTMARNIFTGECGLNESKSPVFKTGGIEIAINEAISDCNHISIRPEDIIVTGSSGNQEVNCLAGEVTGIIDKDSFIELSVDLPPVFTCQVNRNQFVDLNLIVGSTVNINILPESVSLFK